MNGAGNDGALGASERSSSGVGDLAPWYCSDVDALTLSAHQAQDLDGPVAGDAEPVREPCVEFGLLERIDEDGDLAEPDD